MTVLFSHQPGDRVEAWRRIGSDQRQKHNGDDIANQSPTRYLVLRPPASPSRAIAPISSMS